MAALCLLACQVYDPGDLQGAAGETGSASGGSTSEAGGASAASGRGGATGGAGGSAGSTTPDAGEAGTAGGSPSTEGGRSGAGGSSEETGGAIATGGTPAVEQNLLELRIEPADAVLSVGLGEPGTLDFKAFGTFEDEPETEYDITARSVFYVPDNYLVGGFPEDGASSFATLVPEAAGDPAQRGGLVTIEVRAGNADGSIAAAETTLTVVLDDDVPAESDSPWATPALPDDLAGAFDGELAAALDPSLVYPNAGVLLPQNLGGIEVHFLPGSAGGELFEVTFQSELANLRYYTRCYSDPAAFEDGACALFVPASDFAAIAASNAGAAVELAVRASDEAGNYGQSEAVELFFSDEPIDGAVYYWTSAADMSSDARTDRFDFGSTQTAAETFLTRQQVPGASGTCMGCHIPSRQGDKLFFSLGSSSNGQLEFIADMTLAKDAEGFFTYSGGEIDLGQSVASQQNRVLLGAFSPDGAEFVSTAPVNDPEPDTMLFFHSGVTGVRSSSVELPFIPGHPDWSFAGDRIAMTAIGSIRTGVEFTNGGIAFIERDGDGWDAANPVHVVPAETGKNRYYPAFLPDDSLLLFGESDQASYSGDAASSCEQPPSEDASQPCDGYLDPAAKIWAVEPASDATPIFLATAAAPGVADEMFPPAQVDTDTDDLLDTHPRPVPFAAAHAGEAIYFVSMSSQRRAGLRRVFPNGSVVGTEAAQTLLWMFALDPALVLGGEDGSSPPFFLPFQDFERSQHVPRWTERVVSDDPPPRRPALPPPPPPPPDPELPEPPPPE